jgi:uncharacterized protein YceH (UPF0502 family)
MSTLPLLLLNPLEARVLGCLLEKEMATPEYYPLTLSSLAAACNQKSNRDPVMSLDESIVEKGLEGLRRDHRLASLIREAGARVPKYRHEFTNIYKVNDTEKAVLAELILRGPQTVAELKTRCARLVGVVDATAIETALSALEDLAGIQLVAKLPRAHGSREGRYAQLLCGEVSATDEHPLVIELPPPPESTQITALESEVRQLRQELETLRSAFDTFRKTFE